MVSVSLDEPVNSLSSATTLPCLRACWGGFAERQGFAWALGAGALMLGLTAVESEGFPEYRPETARDYLRAVVEMAQSQLDGRAEVCFSLARVWGQLGGFEEAKRWARLALERDPNRAEIQSFLAGLFIHEDRMEEAAACLREALRARPDNAADLRRLGMVLDRLGDREGARTVFERAISVAPGDATARLVLGRLLLDQGKTSDALDHLERACQLDAEQAGAFYALAEAQNRLGDSAEAQESLKRFQELKRKERDAYDLKHRTYDDDRYMRGVVGGFHAEVAGLLVRQGESGLAESHLRQAVRIAPEAADAQEMLAALLLRAGRRAEAREACAALVRLNPNQAIYRANLGTLLLQLNEPAAAVDELNRALELDPGQPEALNNLARFYLGARRNLPEALSLSRRLAELRPTAANCDLLGWALYANGRTEEARAAAAEAVELDPSNPVYRERLQRLGGAL